MHGLKLIFRATLLLTTLAGIGCGCDGCGNNTDPTADGGDGDSEPPDPYAPSDGGAPVCELSADCPDGTHCDLGQCVQSCNTVDPCTGELTCNPRGTCVESAEEPTDPPPSTDFVAEVVADESPVFIDEDENFVTLSFSATPASQELRYRIESRVPWLTITEERGTFTGSFAVSAAVNREGLEPGSHSGSVVLHTEAGDAVVSVQMELGLSGVYRGEIHYENPRPLGTVPVTLELVEDRGFVDLRVISDQSPTFPTVSERLPTAMATFTDNVLSGSITQRLDTEQLGGAGSFLSAPLGRIFEFDLSTTSTGGLAGEFTERWIGLFPAAVEVSGRLVLSRIPDALPGEFTADGPPALPDNPTINSPSITSTCGDVAETSPGSPAICHSTVTVDDLVECGLAIFDVGESWEDRNLISPSSLDPSTYDTLANLCRDELIASEGEGPTNSEVSCVRMANLDCAIQFLGAAARAGSQEGFRGLSQIVSARAGLGMLIANDDLVDAFEAPFVREVGLESAVLENLQDARVVTEDALQYIFDPYLLEILRTTHSSTAESTDYRGLRRFAQLLSTWRTAADEHASLRLRTRPSEREDVAEEINADGPALLVAVVTLATIEEAQDAPATPELAIFSETLTQLGLRSLQAIESLDPLGLPSSYIPFVYDASMAGPDRSTNFHQVLANHLGEVSLAVTAEVEAREAMRAYDANLDALEDEIESIRDQMNTRLIQLCGPDPSDAARPNLENCETGAGELAVALSRINEEHMNLQIAYARIVALGQRVRIQQQRLVEVHSIRLETIAFVDNTNAEINALQYANVALETAQTLVSIAANTGIGSPGAAAAGGIAAVLTYAQGMIGIQQDELRQAQEMRCMEADASVEYINGMATIQEMLVGMNELNLEMTLAVIRGATAQQQYENLLAEVSSVQARADFLESQALDDLVNDPSFRVTRSRAVRQAIATREQAQWGMALAVRAFEYETNTDFPSVESHLVSALTASDVEHFSNCLSSAFVSFREAYGTPTQYDNEVSLREDILGIRGPVNDSVTGEVISEAEQFRRLLLAPANIAADGTVSLTFVTTLMPGNGVFNTNVCNDQIRSLQVKLIGDGLGDNEASVVIQQAGTSLMRSCDSGREGQGDIINEYDIAPSSRAVVQVGVNDYPSSNPDGQLFGRSVATTEWTLTFPNADVAPTNADLDLTSLDDVVIRIEHTAISLSEGVISYDPSCTY